MDSYSLDSFDSKRIRQLKYKIARIDSLYRIDLMMFGRKMLTLTVSGSAEHDLTVKEKICKSIDRAISKQNRTNLKSLFKEIGRMAEADALFSF